MNDFASKVRLEVLYQDCCNVHPAKSLVLFPLSAPFPEIVLDFNFGNWHDIIDEQFVWNVTKDYNYISVSICDIPSLSAELCEWLSKHVGNKLIQITIERCNTLTWKGHIKKILQNANQLESINLKGNKWANDGVVEQITGKFAKTLRAINLENTPITDHALYHIGRKCLNLRDIALTCCSGVTDAGLAELTRRIHLSNLRIGHMMNVSDAGIEKLLAMSNQLACISFVNCPQLGDRSMASIYESVVMWGKKRNLKSQTLKTIELRDNPNFSFQSLAFLSTAVPGLRSLNLLDCSGLDLVKGMAEMEGVRQLEELYLGPSEHPMDSGLFLESMLFHAANLKVLHLFGMPDLQDEHVAELLIATLLLDDLVLSDVLFGTNAIEAMCSNIPNISKLVLIGSSLFEDKHIRCIATVCLHLKEFSIKRCPLVTDGGFTRCAVLRNLELLDVAYCSSKLNGALVGSIALCPLKTLRLDGIILLKVLNHFPKFSQRTMNEMTELSLRDCPNVTVEDCYFLLSHFLHCRSIDLTNCKLLSPKALLEMSNPNPFLHFNSVSSDFMGFLLSASARIRFEQHWSTVTHIRKHKAVKLFQKVRGEYLIYVEELAEKRRKDWILHKKLRVILIQSTVRMFVTRRRFKRLMKAGRMIVSAAIRFLIAAMHRKIVKAKSFYKIKIQRLLFNILWSNKLHSGDLLDNKTNSLMPRLFDNSRRRTYSTIRHTAEGVKQDRVCVQAMVVWEGHLLKRMISFWKQIRWKTINRKLLLVRVFLNCLDLRQHNSTVQIAQLSKAYHFHLTRLMIPAWLCFCDDFLRARRADLLMPRAAQHFVVTFFERVVSKCYQSMDWYRKLRLWKKSMKIRGDNGVAHWRSLIGGRKIWNYSVRRKRHKQGMLVSFENWKTFWKSVAIFWRFPENTERFKNHRVSIDRAEEHICTFKSQKAVGSWTAFVIRTLKWRDMNGIAENFRDHLMYKHFVAAWKLYSYNSKNGDAYYYHEYLLRVAKKLINILLTNVEQNKEYVRAMQEQLAANADRQSKEIAAADAYRIFIKGLILYQAQIRGFKARKEFAARKIQMLYAVQVLQQFVRRGLAYKHYANLVRKHVMMETKRADHENDLMYHEDLDTRFYEFQIKCIMNVQRTFRGWKGRVLGMQIVYDNVRANSKENYEKIAFIRNRFEAYKRAAQAREHLRFKAAVEIQKIIRGVLGRRRFVKVKRQHQIDMGTVAVQAGYRRHLGELKLRSMARDKAAELRFRFARNQRGFLMRLFGVNKRKYQTALGIVLGGLGVDPISFNYRIKELIQETKSDFERLVSVFKREKELVVKHKHNLAGLRQERRQIITQEGWGIKVDDAVRITQHDHPYQGYTGLVVRIDKSVLGLPLFEIKLDRFPRQTFVQMTTDPVQIYELPQPLKKIELHPSLEGFEQPFVLYGLDPEDPFYKSTNVDAAWTIQRGFRMYRARKFVARRRYELWSRCADLQFSLFDHLAETNTMTTQANNLTNLLGVRPKKRVFFDEMRHPIAPGRYSAHVKTMSEEASIQVEFVAKYKARLLYLQKCAIMKGRECFTLGYERFTRYKKFHLFTRMTYGLLSKGGTNVRDLFGARGARFLANQTSMVTGLDKYTFPQLQSSPHVRYPKTSLYQGEWSGIPLFTVLKPHGEGVAMFLDGWGFAIESKVLYLQIVCCRYLNACDLNTSDPYCDIFCNGMNLQSSVKWENLNPVYHETFEIDVTNPMATLNIKVMDMDYVGNHDFMGQILLNLSDYVDGHEHHKTFLLKGEDVDEHEDFDRGEIEIKLRWTDRLFEDDLMLIELKRVMATRIQSWARRIMSKGVVAGKAKERKEFLELVRQRAVQITNTCRIRLAKKESNRLRRRFRAALKIQKRVRIRIAKKVFKLKQLGKGAAIKIQALMRKCLAKKRVKQMRMSRRANLNGSATVIQKYARRLIVLQVNKRERMKDDDVSVASLNSSSTLAKPTVKDWILTYGVDPEYYLKRNRRITERAFRKMLTMRYVRFIGRFGVVYLDSYPPRATEDELLAEKQGKVSLTVRNDFLSVFVPAFRPICYHKKDALDNIAKFQHTALMHLPSSISLRGSVNFTVQTIQCFVRQYLARQQRALMLKVSLAITKFQRIFRRRNEKYHKSAIRLQSLLRRCAAKIVVAKRRIERNSAVKIQCAYRIHQAMTKAFDLRCVSNLVLLKSSSGLPNHGAEKALEHREHTFWITSDKHYGEIRVELMEKDSITDIWIMTSTFSSSAQYVTISAVANKYDHEFVNLVARRYLPQLKGPRWHKIPITPLQTKYFKLQFYDNHGDPDHMAIRQIRFVKSREISATIVQQPLDEIMHRGPTLGTTSTVTLHCKAIGWPLPNFQWYRNNKLIPYATNAELQLPVRCDLSSRRRTFRCVKCKMVSTVVSENVFHTKCGNCAFVTAFKEVDQYDTLVKGFTNDEETILHEKEKLLTSKLQMENIANSNPKYAGMLAEILVRLRTADEALQGLKESRFTAKQDLEFANRFTNEGIYTCHVTNIRGGSVPIKRISKRTVVVVEKPEPFTIKVHPQYIPRQQVIRKRWTTYSSLQGFFRKGMIEGIVVIYYADGSFYEGPYVSEEWLDSLGRVRPGGRAPDHYGLFRDSTGRTFEGDQVDNHFDPLNLQSFYRVTMANKEIYEGIFCDEQFHGNGMYKYLDGTVYEGMWHRGLKFGHGHHRSAEGWTYEGFFDANRRHGEGAISWADGSMYMGEWYFDKLTGRGIYVSKLRDVYKGELVDGAFEGHGELVYADLSRYCGDFKNGKRHGRGIFTEREGHEYYGNFVNDLKVGEHVVKAIVPIEAAGQPNYEIRIGLYDDNGKLVKWKSKFSSSLATKQFVDLFKGNREMFDSVYSMILAKNLPNLPNGVDPKNADVQDIIIRVRNEAGMLVGQEALRQAQVRMEKLLGPVKEKEKEVAQLQNSIESMGLNTITMDHDIHELHKKFNIMQGIAEDDFQKVEQYWLDDPRGLRRRFVEACENLKLGTVDDYFMFRNHRVPPPFVKKIMNAICVLLHLPNEWSNQCKIIGDCVYNRRQGDEAAIRFNYDCKLVHMMQEYRVYDHVHISAESQLELAHIMADPRFRRDSYYIESTGKVGPLLVDWIKTNIAYVEAAKSMAPKQLQAEEKKIEAFRVKAQHGRKSEELHQIYLKQDAARKQLKIASSEQMDLQEALLRANSMLQFVQESFEYSQQSLSKRDYYKMLEDKIESQRDHFIVQTSLQFVLDGVEANIELETQQKIREALSKGEKYQEKPRLKHKIADWLLEEISTQQETVTSLGMTLGYAHEKEPNEVSSDRTEALVCLTAELVIGRMNDAFNDFAATRAWTTIKGRKFTARFVYVLAWKLWKQEAVRQRDAVAIAAWEEIFTTPEECARRAIEARINTRMSSIAREQGRIWSVHHRLDVEMAERVLADEFAWDYPEDTGKYALEMSEDESGTIPPAQRAQCVCWIKLNPEGIGEARDERNHAMADMFEKEFKNNPAEICFRVLNGIGSTDEMLWIDYADHWRAFNAEEYTKVSDGLMTNMAIDFEEEHEVNPHLQAVVVLESDSIGRFIADPEIAKEYLQPPNILFNASCWGLRHQGMLRKGQTEIRAEHAAMAIRQWHELVDHSENFRKGSYILLSVAAKKDAKQDRFLGFRNKLEKRYAWLFAYLSRNHTNLVKDLGEMHLHDPNTKTFHNLRPSEADNTLRAMEKKFSVDVKNAETAVADVMTKLTTWNTYFGTRQERLDNSGGVDNTNYTATG